MKRSIIAVLAIGAIAFVSCKKEEAPAPADPGAATIKGTLWANTNLDNDTDDMGFYQYNPEYVPSGVVVTAFIDSEQLDPTPDPSYDYQTLDYPTTVGSNGSYSFSVPAYNDPIDVELRFNDFQVNQVQVGGTSVSTTFFMGGSMWVTVHDGAIVIKDYTYSY